MGAEQKQIKMIIRKKKHRVAEYISAGKATDFRCIHSRQMVKGEEGKKNKKKKLLTAHPIISSLT